VTSVNAVHGLCEEKTFARPGVHIQVLVVHKRNVTEVPDAGLSVLG
jgi:hypothetical protein